MPELKGKICYLQAFTEAHLHNPCYLQWLRNYEVIKTLNKVDYLRPVSFDEVQEYCLNVMQSLQDMYFAVHSINKNTFIGTLRVSRINWHSRTADIGIMIGDKNFWGKGIASDAIKMVSAYLFEQCGMRKLTAGYMAINPAMGRAFAKAGFKQEGILREQDYFEGKYVDHIYLGCFKNEFEKGDVS